MRHWRDIGRRGRMRSGFWAENGGAHATLRHICLNMRRWRGAWRRRIMPGERRMPVTIQLPSDLERRLRSEFSDLEFEAREALALELFRRGKLSHFELSQILQIDRVETDALLKRHGVVEGSLTMQDLDEQSRTLEGVLGPVRR